MSALFSFSLDLALIVLLGAGIYYAVKLTRQLADLRKSRADMERFITEFASTVGRAESGIRGLKQAARSCGDDLEQLIEQGTNLRDELAFLIQSADQAATKITDTITKTTTDHRAHEEASASPSPAPTPKNKSAPAKTSAAEPLPRTSEPSSTSTPQLQPAAANAPTASSAERELLRVLGKLR